VRTEEEVVMSQKRWHTLRLRKIETRMRQFWRDELGRARTYQQYATVTNRPVPAEVATVLELMLSGMLGETPGALAVIFRQGWSNPLDSSLSAVESLEERFLGYHRALVEHDLI
jgi:hypothetical protein